MKWKMLSSVLIILMTAATMGGATLAWFTAEATLDNVFTAGTLGISADDNWEGKLSGEVWENANPGDCKPKEFKITNNGSKTMYLRFKFEGEWTTVPNAPVPPGWPEWEADDALVTIAPAEGFESNWKMIEDEEEVEWWYYQGPTDGIIAKDVNLTFNFLVCLDGPGTGNEYQGASYTLAFNFQAIQTTHGAVNDVWGVWWHNGEWVDEEPVEP